MSDSVLFPQAHAYHHASDIPEEVWSALQQNEAAANVILPFAKKASNFPRGANQEQLWIALYDDPNSVNFVLSSTKGPLGDYPIFIVPLKPSAQSSREEARGHGRADPLSLLVHCLLEHVPPQRVFSVFSIAEVTEKFAEIFEERTCQAYGIRALKDPEDRYYDATFMFCNNEMFKESLNLTFPLREHDSGGVSIGLCRAELSHLNGVKTICKAFAETSPPYTLNDEEAESEAKAMIIDQQAWVHLVEKDGHEPEIACLIATTRESDNVTAVTKVFTTEHWRKRNCAARLLHRVCQELLQKKKQLVLYVGNGEKLASARAVYQKIGFRSFESHGQKETWLEIGFEGTNRGYW